jgi:hypothetical protein
VLIEQAGLETALLVNVVLLTDLGLVLVETGTGLLEGDVGLLTGDRHLYAGIGVVVIS